MLVQVGGGVSTHNIKSIKVYIIYTEITKEAPACIIWVQVSCGLWLRLLVEILLQ